MAPFKTAMDLNTSHVVFIGPARCYHTVDWYRSAQRLLAPKKVLFLTDVIESEEYKKLVNEADPIVPLFCIDRFLFKKQSKAGSFWRNVLKTLIVPIQAWRTNRFARSFRSERQAVFHAHTMYFMWVCWLANVKYIGTPQGSEVLVRPKRSMVYRFFARRCLIKATALTVDSIAMHTEIKNLCGRDAHIIQNGIDTSQVLRAVEISQERRYEIVSIRGVHPIYRTHLLIKARNASVVKEPLRFLYPFHEDGYRRECFAELLPTDIDSGRLQRQEMYQVLTRTLLAISIPESDSSPRTVYEAIFCGACVAVTYSRWIEDLPACMKSRIQVVDLSDPDWFSKAVAKARTITAYPYKPSERALDLLDQHRSLARLAALCYELS